MNMRYLALGLLALGCSSSGGSTTPPLDHVDAGSGGSSTIETDSGSGGSQVNVEDSGFHDAGSLDSGDQDSGRTSSGGISGSGGASGGTTGSGGAGTGGTKPDPYLDAQACVGVYNHLPWGSSVQAIDEVPDADGTHCHRTLRIFLTDAAPMIRSATVDITYGPLGVSIPLPTQDATFGNVAGTRVLLVDGPPLGCGTSAADYLGTISTMTVDMVDECGEVYEMKYGYSVSSDWQTYPK